MKPLALLSVTDKTGIETFAKGLVENGFQILSTGGTAAKIKQAGIEVTDVSQYTDFPEMMDGRVKTLHPKVHGAILFDRNDPTHTKAREQIGAGDIQIVAVNLYAFSEKTTPDTPLSEAMHHIDIGGPTMLRAAAKNFQHVLSVCDPSDYERVLQNLKLGPIPEDSPLRVELAAKTFRLMTEYNESIADVFTGKTALRYGENPHQKAFICKTEGGFSDYKQLHGKELSYNNYLDLEAAWRLACDFSSPAVAIVKHNNPCGFASSSTDSLGVIYETARSCDEKSAFGGIVAVNREVDESLAQSTSSQFMECLIAPSFSNEALDILRSKKNLRLMEAAKPHKGKWEKRTISGAKLIQEVDHVVTSKDDLKLVTASAIEDHMLDDLAQAMTVAKHVKSNAIILFRNGQTIGIGAGQMSRIDAAELAAKKSKEAGFDIKGAVLASDAFFPFHDTVDFAAKIGVSAIVQPGGSKRDQDSIDAANGHGIGMVFTGRRHFRH